MQFLMKREFRLLIQYFFLKKMSARESHKEIESVFGPGVVSLSSVRYWFDRFSSGDMSTLDKPRSGRPKIDDLSEKILETLEDVPFASSKFLAFTLGVDKKTIKSRLIEHLHYRKLCLRWIPYSLSEPQKILRKKFAGEMISVLQQTLLHRHVNLITLDESWFFLKNPALAQWVPMGTPRPTAPCPTIGAKKVMVTIVWGGCGFLLVDFLPQSMKMNGKYFQENILKKTKQLIDEAIKIPFPNPFYIHFDNSRVHTAHETLMCLNDCGFTRMIHPPYSPDLAPSDFWLFGFLKEKMKGENFDTFDELEIFINRVLYDFGRDNIQGIFAHWVKRLRSVESGNGDYFE